MVQAENLGITGDLIVSMTPENRWFEVVDKPFYELVPSQGDQTGEQKKKLAVKVKLYSGAIGTYYPNRTSERKMTNLCFIKKGSTEMDDWVGEKFYWGEIPKQKVMGNMKNVLYVTDFYPTTVKV